MTNRLADHLTTWKWWYALLTVPALILGSQVLLVGTLLGEDESSALLGLLSPVSFIAFTVIALLLVALVSRRWPTRDELALRRGLTARDLVVLLVVFVVTHVIFWLLEQGGGNQPGAADHFAQMGLDGPLLGVLGTVVASVLLAPVCEEILYRGLVVRPVHDSLARRGTRPWVAASVGILAGALLFAMPHLGEIEPRQALAYVVTGIGFGLVYVLTGSLTAAMVSHSLQSAAAFGQILLFGAGETDVSPLVHVLVFGCPLWVYLIARGLHAAFPRGRALRRWRASPVPLPASTMPVASASPTLAPLP